MAAEPRTAILPIRPEVAARAALPPWREWTYKDAAAAVAARKPQDYEERRRYAVDDDHYGPNGEGYIGPKPAAGSANALSQEAAIRRNFASYNATGEVLDNVEDAFATEPQLSLVLLDPPDDPEAEIPAEDAARMAEGVGLLSAWWDRVRLWEHAKPALRTAAYAGRANLRPWIPKGYLEATDYGFRIPVLPLEDAFGVVHLSAPEPVSAAVVTDADTQDQASVFLYVVTIDEREYNRAELAFVEDGLTWVRTLHADGDPEPEPAPYALPMGGMLPLAEMGGDVLLTRSVITQQKALDFAESVLNRTVETAGFRERYISNAEPVGEWVLLLDGEVPTGPTREYGGRTYQLKPYPRILGAAITTELVGLQTQTEEGKLLRATPAVESFEPTSPDFATKVCDHRRANIFRQCKQGHLVNTSTAEASGFAYEQARARFTKDLGNRKGAVEGLLRDLLTAVLGYAEAVAKKPGHWTERYRVSVDAHVDAGPRSAEERRQDNEQADRGRLSLETLLARDGVEDPAAEIRRMQDDPGYKLGLLKQAAEVYAMVAQFGSADAAARALEAAGVDPDIVAALRMRDTDGALEP